MSTSSRTGAPAAPAYSFAQLLEQGVGGLRFPEPFETQFRQLHLARCRTRVRFWQTFLVAITLAFGISRLQHGSLGHAASILETALRFGVLIPCWALLAWIAWTNRYERLYWPAAKILIPLSGCVVAALVTIQMVGGRGEALSGFATHMLGLILLSGLLFRQVLWICGAMMLVFIGMALLQGIALITLLFDAVTPLMTVGIGGFVYYEIEKVSRRAFLEQGNAVEQAANDVLTGLKNRRTFNEHLQRIWHHANREGKRLGLLMVDVDDFKRYNDRYGHQAGDRCLKKIADAVVGTRMRPLDLAARFGGEELAVILYDMTGEHVEQTAEHIRAAVEKLGIEHLDSRSAKVVTVSIGAACIPPERERSREGLIQLADEALYESKRRGRNRVTLREDEYRHLSTGVFRNPTLLTPEDPPGAW